MEECRTVSCHSSALVTKGKRLGLLRLVGEAGISPNEWGNVTDLTSNLPRAVFGWFPVWVCGLCFLFHWPEGRDWGVLAGGAAVASAAPMPSHLPPGRRRAGRALLCLLLLLLLLPPRAAQQPAAACPLRLAVSARRVMSRRDRLAGQRSERLAPQPRKRVCLGSLNLSQKGNP
eukprot:COSAG04_NODE_996_length_8869_cov_5.116306_3_plen_174_part_00